MYEIKILRDTVVGGEKVAKGETVTVERLQDVFLLINTGKAEYVDKTKVEED